MDKERVKRKLASLLIITDVKIALITNYNILHLPKDIANFYDTFLGKSKS